MRTDKNIVVIIPNMVDFISSPPREVGVGEIPGVYEVHLECDGKGISVRFSSNDLFGAEEKIYSLGLIVRRIGFLWTSPKGIFLSNKNRITPFFSNPLSPTSHPNGSVFVTVDAMSSTGLSLQCSPGSRPAVLAKSGQMSPPYIRSTSMSPIYRRYGGVDCLCSRNQREVVSRNPHRRAK